MNRIGLITLVVILSVSVVTAGGCAALDGKSEQSHDVAVTNMSAPSSCVQGETVSIIVDLQNQGNCSEIVQVILSDVADGYNVRKHPIVLSQAGVKGVDTTCDLILDAEGSGPCNIGSFISSGDINADGIEDLVYTAPVYDDYTGRVYAHYGSRYFDKDPDFLLTGTEPNMKFGNGFCLGDINNDGHVDLIIGANWFRSMKGRVYVYYGGPVLDDTVDLILENPEEAASSFGRELGVGDINGDGFNDLVVCAVRYDNARGRCYLYYGRDSLDPEPDKVFEGEERGQHFGREIVVGDTDGDGVDDILFGSAAYDGDGYNLGRAYLHYGAEDTSMGTVYDEVFTGESDGDACGSALGICDIDGDGIGEILICSRYWNNGQGKMSIWWGGTRNIDDTRADLCLYGDTRPVPSHFQGHPSSHGHFNGDDYLDILVGGSGAGNRNAGKAFLFYGGTRALMDNKVDKVFLQEEIGSLYGPEACAADLNDDGYDEAVIADVLYSRTPERGRVYLYWGSPGDCTQLTFNWETTKASTGEHTLKVEVVPVVGEEDTADNTQTAVVNVESKVKDK